MGGLGDRRQGPGKTKEGASQPDRKAQCESIKQQGQAFPRRRQPVVWVAAKKKEWVGDFAHGGRDDQPHGHPERVRG